MICAPLFLPADRLDRLSKAVGSGADAIILDLEDGVAAPEKTKARKAVAKMQRQEIPFLVRMNGIGTPWHDEDLSMVSELDWLSAVVLPKSDFLPTSWPPVRTWALIETAAGIDNARGLAVSRKIDRLVFGSIDYCADMGCAHTRSALLSARSELVLASRLADLAPPIDGVHANISDLEGAESEARYAQELGFSGKLAIHPSQIPPIRRGFAPSQEKVAWAREIIGANDGATAVGGMMVDAPVRAIAAAILQRADMD